MKNKKFIIALLFIVLVASVSFMFWKKKQQDDDKKHAEDTYRRMTDMAKKSGISGLPQMARAIDRYLADNQNYPPTLQALYPKYIQWKFFIDEVPWQYKRRGNDFLLSKSILRGSKTLVASIDNTLKPKTGRKAMLAAARQSASKRTASPQPARPAAVTLAKKKKTAAPTPTKAGREPAHEKALMNPIAFSDFYKQITAFKQMQTPTKNLIEKIQVPPPDEDQAASGTIAGLSLQYMVWKDKNGYLGFSDVQYPDEPVVDSICVNGRWEKYPN